LYFIIIKSFSKIDKSVKVKIMILRIFKHKKTTQKEWFNIFSILEELS